MMLADWTLVIFSLLWSASYACNPNEFCVIDVNNENIMNLLTSMDYFTTQLIQKLIYNPNVNTNVVISPLSIYVVLTLMLFGSAGECQKELIKALHFPDTDMQELQKSFGDILIATEVTRSKMVNGNEVIELQGHLVQGLFFQKDFTLVDAYAQYLKNLNVKTQPVDFVNNMEDAINVIKKWIEDSKPGNNLLSLSDSINECTRIFLTTLFYFNAKWEENLFLDSASGPVPFHTLDNAKIDVEMMKTLSTLLYYDNESSYSAVEIPYGSVQDFTAIFILPNKEVDSIEFATSFTMDILVEFYSKAELKDVKCQIPKFSYSYSVDLNNQLEGLGMKQLLKKADLSNMLKMKEEEDIAVPMSHTCEITVNEKGTMSDSSTDKAVAEATTNAPEEHNSASKNLTLFILDRPFLMLIRSTETYAIAFATFFHKV